MQNKLYNLNSLVADLQGDKDAIVEMVRIFLEFTPINLAELNNAFDESDYYAISLVAHKMKYSISNYGIDSIKDDILAIERLSKQKVPLNEIKFFIDNVNSVLTQVFENIKQEIT